MNLEGFDISPYRSNHFLPSSRILSSILQMFIPKLVEDTEHYHGGQGLTRLSKQGIGPEHHGRERRAVQTRKRWAVC